MLPSAGDYLEGLLHQCGGFGKFQWVLVTVLMLSKIGVAWSMLMMSVAGAIPDWWCTALDSELVNSTNLLNGGGLLSVANNSYLKECRISLDNITLDCDAFLYHHNLRTVVSEWNLVCSDDWIASTITTIQMAGLFAGCLVSGHLADAFGRKPIYFLSMTLLVIFNLASAFSISWEMFAVFRFFIGLACGGYLTVFFIFLVEFLPLNYRPLVSTIPTYPMWVACLALVGWWLHDWRKLHIATAIVSSPWLLFWWFIPESFRWLASNGKQKQAEIIIMRIALMNGCAAPDMSEMEQVFQHELKSRGDRVYSIKDVCMSSTYRTPTLLFMVCWLTGSYVYYAISFGVQTLYGDIYINLALIQLTSIPGLLLTYIGVNRFGRKPTIVFCFTMGCLSAIIVAVFQTEGVPGFANKEILTTVFALLCRIAVGAAWAALMILTSETYPTVIRTIGYGLQNSAARVGGMIAPQAVYLNDHAPGIMYYLCGGLSLLSALCTMCVTETRGKVLRDTLEISIKHDRNQSETEPLIKHDTSMDAFFHSNEHFNGFQNGLYSSCKVSETKKSSENFGEQAHTSI